MKSACRIPIRLKSLQALTAPRGVPAAAPFYHHHSLLPLHVITAFWVPLSPPVFRWPLRPCNLLPSPTTPRLKGSKEHRLPLSAGNHPVQSVGQDRGQSSATVPLLPVTTPCSLQTPFPASTTARKLPVWPNFHGLAASKRAMWNAAPPWLIDPVGGQSVLRRVSNARKSARSTTNPSASA